ncbi:endonuclease/exonuclease/phosphatase [Purpureocillium lavendulum]|uniref:Endonuclease/exonuclease/phosphatase n=1 Tax=Purpureocillium lavendulum TaxID=1247861 RepID=A0AB34FCM3_9HYPO|nr:endonuclease/exonuclease/phosphatase [Purpureocillium lavendulum]
MKTGTEEDHYTQWINSRTKKTFATSGSVSELDKYFRLELQDTQEPIQWWRDHGNSFPALSSFALDVLAIPAMASDCERQFSLAKLTLTSQRPAMGADTLERIHCLRNWAVIGAFRTVATAVAEAEASIPTIEERHRQAATRLCVDLRTLPQTHPLAALRNKASRRYLSPMQGIASVVAKASTERMEVIGAFALRPWAKRIPVSAEMDLAGTVQPPNPQGIIITTASSQKDGRVGMGGVVCDTTHGDTGRILGTYSVALGPDSEQNPYTAELAAIEAALRNVPPGLVSRDVTVVTSNRSAAIAIRRPRQQSGQCTIRQIYDRAKHLQKNGCCVRLMWLPAKDERCTFRPLAKAAAQRATEQECVVETPPYQASSTTLRLALARERPREQLPDSVGKYLKRIDKALPGRHTRALYEALKRRESDVLAQLRTGMMRLNSYLRKIGAAESDMCDCGQAPETTEHFLFRCKKWSGQREILFTCSRTKIGNLSFFLGGKATSDDDKWEPDMRAVGFLSLLTDSSAVGKQNFLSCYQIAREQALTVSNIKGGWKATGLWPVSVAKPLLSPLLLENSNKRKNDAKNTHTAFRSPFSTSEWQTDASQIAWSTPKRPQDLKVQVLQFNQLDDDVPTKRLLFRKITKGFDEKDGLLAKAQLQIQALETQLPAVKPKKRKRVETSPNSRFADIEAVQRRRRRSMQLRKETLMEPKMKFQKSVTIVL